MAQVVTNANIQDLIKNGSVPEFKAPEVPAASAKPADAAAAAASSSNSAGESTEQQARGADGKFVKTDGAESAKAQAGEGKTEEAPAAPAAEDDDDTSNLSEPIKRKIDRLIAKKHRAMKEAEEFGRDEARRAMAAETRAEQLQREIDELKKSGSGPAPAKDSGSDPDEPKPEDFKTVGEYTRALTKYEVAKAAKEARARGEQVKQQTQADERAAAFAKRQSAFIATTPDYEKVVEAADFEFPPVGMQYLVESEYGPQLAYHLAKNPKEADRLRSLSPARVLAELGKLEIRFEQKPASAETPPAAAAAAPVSRAPAPITPLEGKSTTVPKDPKDMTFQELRAHRMAERAAGKK